MERIIREIFERITEEHNIPLRIGSRCEANTYYRIEDLSGEDIEQCAEYLAERINNVCAQTPEVLISLPGSYTGLAQDLAKFLSLKDSPLPVYSLEKLIANGLKQELKGKKVALVNDVITTARSCLEAHTRTTMFGASVLCWVSLVDRTFGPGPVPVVAAFTGEPVLLLEDLA